MREQERTEFPKSTTYTDFHDDTLAHLQKCRAEADDPATKRIFTEQIAIQEKRKSEAPDLKHDSRRRNTPRIG